MSKAEPVIQKYMTYQPETIDVSETLEAAEKLMQKLKIRHLPVTKEGKLHGIISDRDIKMAGGIVGTDPALVRVHDICHEHPYRVTPDTKLHEVLDEMVVHHYGSVLVVQNHQLVGIFTTVDACRAFSDVLQKRFHEHI